MTTDIKVIASLVATQVWCNGEYSEVEIETTEEIAEAFELPVDEFKALVADCATKLDQLDEDAVEDFLEDSAEQVADDEVAMVYEALMQMALCDGVLTQAEVENLLAVADALDIDESMATLLLCDMVKEEPELEISFED